MKNAIGLLLSATRHLINAATLLAAFAYVCFLVLWMHASMADVLRFVAPIALWPLGLAWLCGRIGGHLRKGAPILPSAAWARLLLAACGVVMVANASTAIVEARWKAECAKDPSRSGAAHELQTRRDGFEHVCRGELARFDIALGALDRATGKLAFTPVDLRGTPFAKLQSLGGSAEQIADVPSRLYRGFRTADGHRLILSEHDMSADGSRAWRDPKDEPERIEGAPARLVVLQDASGAAVSHLSWGEGRRFYELWIDANVVTTPLRERLFALAASLPPSVPACPNEVLPKAERFDAPMPAQPTQAEGDAMFDRTKRPCK